MRIEDMKEHRFLSCLEFIRSDSIPLNIIYLINSDTQINVAIYSLFFF